MIDVIAAVFTVIGFLFLAIGIAKQLGFSTSPCMCGTHTMGFRASTCDCPRCGPYNRDPDPIGVITGYQIKSAIVDYLAVEDRDADWFINRLEEYEDVHKRAHARYLVEPDTPPLEHGSYVDRLRRVNFALFGRPGLTAHPVTASAFAYGSGGSYIEVLRRGPTPKTGEFAGLEALYGAGKSNPEFIKTMNEGWVSVRHRPAYKALPMDTETEM